jgi:hypothetical protein
MVSCDAGFDKSHASVTCQANGEWESASCIIKGMYSQANGEWESASCIIKGIIVRQTVNGKVLRV